MSKKFLLNDDQIPKQWYNIIADMPNPPTPPLGPDGKPISPDALSAIFPDGLIAQEVSGERWIDIPAPVREAYGIWRPTPLIRATRLEELLGTPAKLFYKYEGISPAGSHKPNTAFPQAYYNAQEGIKRLSSETGAGQWGSSIAQAGNYFGLDVDVFMVRVSYEQKPYRRSLMQTWGASVVPSPTNSTEAGRKILAEDPNSPGSLGIAISEAVEVAATNRDTNYTLGSVLNHVLLHQTIIGLEAKEQFKLAGESPDVIFAPCGGGSNFAGVAFPYLPDKWGGKDIRLVAVEPASCPTLTKGKYAFDYGDTVGLTPIVKMYTLGHDFVPPSIHAGGLRYHGDAPLVSQLYHEGHIDAIAVPNVATFEAGVTFARAEGYVPAPESCHAVRAAIDEALRCKASGEAKTIFFNLSGHGNFDMMAYDKYFSNELEDYAYPEEEIEKSMQNLPKVDFP